jgi:hypothetical protein
LKLNIEQNYFKNNILKLSNMAANTSNPTGSQIEIQRVEKTHEASYLEGIQSQGYEHLGDPLQIEFNKSMDEIRNWVLAQAMSMDANLISEVENPPVAPGQNPIIVYYIWKIPQAQTPAVEPQAFACPYCTQPFMAVPGPQQQVVACPNCGGANIIPPMEVPPEPAPAETPPAPAAIPTQTQEIEPTQTSETPPEHLSEIPDSQPSTEVTPAPVVTQAPTQEPAPQESVPTSAPAATTPAPSPTPTAAPTATTTQTPTASTTPAAATAPMAQASETQPQEQQQEQIQIQPEAAPEQTTDYQQDNSYDPNQPSTQYSTDYPSFDYFTKKVDSDTNKPKAPLLTPEYEQAYNTKFTSVEQAVKINMEKLANLLANPKNTIKFYDSGELMYPKVTIRKSAYTHLGTREMDLLLIKDGVNDYKIIANETHGATGGAITPMQDELFALKTLGHASYRAMEDWAYLDNEQKLAVSKCVFAFTDIYLNKLPKEVPTQ